MSQKNKRILTRKEEKHLFKVREDPRDYMLIATTLKHGLRNSEAVSLQRKHTDLEESVIKVIEGKNNKDRLVPIPSDFQDELKYYFDEQNINEPEDYLFPSYRSDSHLTPRAFEMKMRYYAIKGGLYPDNITYDNVARKIPYEERIVPHSLRHTYATRMLRAGEPMAKVSRLLGHEGVEVTVDVYGHMDIEDLRPSVEVV